MSFDQNDFRAALDYLGLTQAAAGKFLGVGERTVRRWADGSWPPSRTVMLLFAVMIKKKITVEQMSRYIKK